MTGETSLVLLRGINVGRGNRLSMADLRAALESAGCTRVRTHLQSGNAVVQAEPDGLVERVEAALPLPVPVVVFSAGEVEAVVEACPWRAYADASPKLVHVAFLSAQPAADRLVGLAGGHGDDEVAVGERVLYLRYTTSSLDSPATTALTRAKLDVVVTARNWRTVTALRELLSRPG